MDLMTARTPRMGERLPASANAVIRQRGALGFQGTVQDASCRGCRLEFVVRPKVGESLWVKFDGLEKLAAKVCWLDGFIGGVEFESPLHPAVFAMLAERIGSGVQALHQRG